MKVIETMIKSFFASLFISIGCAVNIACISKGYPIAGAIMFAIGLLCVCIYGANLYTGKIGFVVKNRNYLEVFLILIFNLIFSYLIGLLSANIVDGCVVQNIINNKLNMAFFDNLLKSIFCGILMFLAVDMHKNHNTVLGILFAVPVFILSGFEHCIANITYFGLAKCFNLKMVLFMLTNILGNTIGGVLIPLLTKLEKHDKIKS